MTRQQQRAAKRRAAKGDPATGWAWGAHKSDRRSGPSRIEGKRRAQQALATVLPIIAGATS